MNIDELLQAEVAQANADLREWSGELGGQDVTIYSKPLCPRDFDYLKKKGHPDFTISPSVSGMVEMIAYKAQDENGAKMFKPNKHVPLLLRVSTKKIGEVFSGLFGDDMESEDDEAFEERVGNSEKT